MAHSLRSGSDNKIKHDLKNGATVVCHRNSVFRVKADILVTSRNGSVESCVREKVGASEWDRKKRNAESFYISDWKFVNISTFDSKPDFHYSNVYVVQVPVFNSRNPKIWLEDYQKMIKHLLTEADKDHESSITIPLLGTNAGGAPKNECIRRVMDAIFTFPKFTSLQKINIVVQDWPEFTLVQDLFEKHEKPKPKYSDENKKYNHIAGNKKKSHLFPSTNIHTTDKPNSGNRFNGLSHSNDKRKVDTSRGDNPDLRHRSNSRDSRKRRSSDSSTGTNTDELQLSNNNSGIFSPDNGSTPPNKEKELKIRRHQSKNSSHNVKNRETGKIGSSGIPAIREVSLPQCSYCSRSKTNRIELRCHHEFCIFCAPSNQSCPQCKVDTGNERFSKRAEEYGSDIGNRVLRSSERTQKRKYCEHCFRYKYVTIFELPCRHICCYICLPYDKSCPQCKVDKRLSNKAEENGADQENRGLSSSEQTHEKDVTYSPKKHSCKSCFGFTFSKLKELPCHHFCCIFCFDYQKTCQQCKVDKLNHDDTSNQVKKLKERTSDQDVHHCKSCFDYTFKELMELPCRHFCCFLCYYDQQSLDNPKNCQQCKAEKCIKDKSSKTDNRDGSSRKGTHREGRDITMVQECNRCKLDLTNKSSVRSPCGHTLCVKCSPKGCNDKFCIQESEGNRGQSSIERTHREGRDTPMVEECNRCKLDLTNKSSVRSPCGHTLCVKCLPDHHSNRGTYKSDKYHVETRPKYPGNSEWFRSTGNDRDSGTDNHIRREDDPGYSGQSSREQTHRLAGINKDEEISSEPGNGGRSLRRETHGDGRCIKYEEKHRDQSSRDQTLQDDPGYRSSGSREQTYRDDPGYRRQSLREQLYRDDPGYRSQNSRKQTFSDDHGNRSQSSREQNLRDDPGYISQSSREQTLRDDPGYRSQSSREQTLRDAPGYGQSSRERTLKDDPGYRRQRSREQTLRDDPGYRSQSSIERTFSVETSLW